MSSECSAQEKPFRHLLASFIHTPFTCGPGGAALPFAPHSPAAPATRVRVGALLDRSERDMPRRGMTPKACRGYRHSCNAGGKAPKMRAAHLSQNEPWGASESMPPYLFIRIPFTMPARRPRSLLNPDLLTQCFSASERAKESAASH